MNNKKSFNKTEILNLLSLYKPGEKSQHSLIEPPDTRLIFNRIDEKDIDEFHSYSTDERLYEGFEFKPHKTIDDTKEYFQKMKNRMELDQTHFYWFVRLQDTSQLIGSVAIADIDYDRDSLQWGYAIDPKHWGQNYIIEIQETLKHYIFDVLNFNRLYGITMLHNHKTIASLKASGCIHEGVLRDHYKKDEIYIDGWAYSILAREYYNSMSNIDKKNHFINIDTIVKFISLVIEDEKINETSSMNNSPGWDSLMQMKIVTALSEEYNVKIMPKDVAQLTSIKSILNFLNNN